MYIMTEDGWKMLSPRECIEAPRNSVFKETPIEEAQSICAERADDYCVMVDRYLKNEISFIQVFSVFHRPLYGAYGERI